MTRAQFVRAARKAAEKARFGDFRIVATETEEGVVGMFRGSHVRIICDVVDGPAMALARDKILADIRNHGQRQERAA